jgi:hypothetical protein
MLAGTKIPSAAVVMVAEVLDVRWSNAVQILPGNKVEVLLFWVTGFLVKET